MANIFRHILFITVLPFIITNSFASNKVIYGQDDRRDVFDVADHRFVQWAESTAAMIKKSKVVDGTIISDRLEDGGVCSDERFAEQSTAANCSGFLVAEDILVTAGHCMRTAYDCSGSYWVFGYKQSVRGYEEIEVTENDVYECQQILATELSSATKNDYAVVKLDRPVVGRTPLKIRSEGKIMDGTPLVVIGHPSGLPTKVAAGAVVRENDNDVFFSTNLDTFGGNSGSAVFNAISGEIEGILVRGEQDYTYDYSSSCRRVNVCDEFACRGEDVTRITNLKEDLEPFVVAAPEPTFQIVQHSFEDDDIDLTIPDRNFVTYSFDGGEIDKILSLSLRVVIKHTYIGDLVIKLTSPGGKEVTLRSRTGSWRNDIDDTYEDELQEFVGESSKGEWILTVEDKARYDVGKLMEVVFDAEGERELEPVVVDPVVVEDKSCEGVWRTVTALGIDPRYDSLVNKCGEELRDEMKSVISPHNSLSYSEARVVMFSELDNVNGEVCSVYSTQCVTTDGVPNANIMNTEHSWPQSKGATGIAKSDLHHLFPTMSRMNSRRSNYPFCEVSTVSYDGGESRLGNSERGTKCFEPMDSHKGDLARAMFYFAIRYGKHIDSEEEGFFRKWAQEDTVSIKEIERNDGIEVVQGNRNPFVDIPVLIELIEDF